MQDQDTAKRNELGPDVSELDAKWASPWPAAHPKAVKRIVHTGQVTQGSPQGCCFISQASMRSCLLEQGFGLDSSGSTIST